MFYIFYVCVSNLFFLPVLFCVNKDIIIIIREDICSICNMQCKCSIFV